MRLPDEHRPLDERLLAEIAQRAPARAPRPISPVTFMLVCAVLVGLVLAMAVLYGP